MGTHYSWHGDSSAALKPRQMQIFVKALAGCTLVVDVASDLPTEVVKQRIEDIDGIPSNQQRLTFAGKQLEDGRTLQDYAICHGSSLSLTLSLLGGGKKKKKKKKKKSDEPAEKKTPEQLLEEIQDWTLKLQKAREERNYFQLERDKIKYFWDMTQKELTIKKSELLNKDQGQHGNREGELSNLKKEQKLRLKDLQFANEDDVKRLSENHSKKFYKMRETFHKEASELESQFELRLSSLRDELELRRKVELHELEERKSLH